MYDMCTNKRLNDFECLWERQSFVLAGHEGLPRPGKVNCTCVIG